MIQTGGNCRPSFFRYIWLNKRYVMKYFVPILFVLFTVTGRQAIAQSIYFRGGLGYAAAQGGQVYSPIYSSAFRRLYLASGSYSSNNIDPNNASESFKLNKGSMSSGVKGTLALGIMLTEHIGVELGADIGITTQTQEFVLADEEVQIQTSLVVKQKAQMPVFLTPALIVQSGGKINVYARGGVTIPVKTTIEETYEYTEDTYNPATQQIVRTGRLSIAEEYNMRLSLGFSGAVGAQFSLSKNMSFFAEVNMLSMTLYYKQSEITKAIDEGVNILPVLSPTQRTTKYEFDGFVNGTDNISPTSAVPFSNIGVSVGVVLKVKP